MAMYGLMVGFWLVVELDVLSHVSRDYCERRFGIITQKVHVDVGHDRPRWTTRPGIPRYERYVLRAVETFRHSLVRRFRLLNTSGSVPA